MQIEENDRSRFLLAERKIGPWFRSFTVPIDVDMKGLRAKLEGGLLRLDFPTKDMSQQPGVEIVIE